jgi:phospholipid/cholesterol/gamma-HCH transport system permease protein
MALPALKGFFEWFGDVSLFGIRAIRDVFRPPFEIDEIINQAYEAGWRSLPLIILSGFALGVILAIQTRTEMQSFGAQAMIPQAVSMGLFADIGPLIAAMMIAGRVGAGTGSRLAEMRVTEQIDALEALGVNSFKYLVVTRIMALVIVMPILTMVLNFSGLLGGMVTDIWDLHMSWRLFMHVAFAPMGWSNYIPPTAKTIVFGFVIGTVSCFLGYNAKQGAAGVGRASTYSVVLSLLLVILSDVILEKLTLFLFPG